MLGFECYDGGDFDIEETFLRGTRRNSKQSPSVNRPTKKELRSRRRQSNIDPNSQFAVTELAVMRRFLKREDGVMLAAATADALANKGEVAKRSGLTKGLGASLLTASMSTYLFQRNYATRSDGPAQFRNVVDSHQAAANDTHPTLRMKLGDIVVFGEDDLVHRRKRFLGVQLVGEEADILDFETLDLLAALGSSPRSRRLITPHITLAMVRPGEPADEYVQAIEDVFLSLGKDIERPITLGPACTRVIQKNL